MIVSVNGAPRRLDPGSSVKAVVAALGAGATGTAVAVNGEVVPRSAWDSRELAADDSVEVLTAVPGG